MWQSSWRSLSGGQERCLLSGGTVAAAAALIGPMCLVLQTSDRVAAIGCCCMESCCCHGPRASRKSQHRPDRRASASPCCHCSTIGLTLPHFDFPDAFVPEPRLHRQAPRTRTAALFVPITALLRTTIYGGIRSTNDITEESILAAAHSRKSRGTESLVRSLRRGAEERSYRERCSFGTDDAALFPCCPHHRGTPAVAAYRAAVAAAAAAARSLSPHPGAAHHAPPVPTSVPRNARHALVFGWWG